MCPEPIDGVSGSHRISRRDMLGALEEPHMPNPLQPSLYSRLGGYDAIAAVAEANGVAPKKRTKPLSAGRMPKREGRKKKRA